MNIWQIFGIFEKCKLFVHARNSSETSESNIGKAIIAVKWTPDFRVAIIDHRSVQSPMTSEQISWTLLTTVQGIVHSHWINQMTT